MWTIEVERILRMRRRSLLQIYIYTIWWNVCIGNSQMTSLMCSFFSLDMIYRTLNDSPCGKHIIPKWTWYSVVATDDCCLRRRRCCCYRHGRVHSRVLNVFEFVTWSEPFVESRSHLTVVTNIYSIHQRDICSLSPFRYVWHEHWCRDCKQVIERFIWNSLIFFIFTKLSHAFHITHTHTLTHTSQQDCDRFMQMNGNGSSGFSAHIDAIQRFLLLTRRNSYKNTNFKWTETEDHWEMMPEMLESVSVVVVDRKR